MARPTAELVREFAPAVEEVRGELTGRQSLIDTTRARTILGFRPQYSVNDERHDA
jgi:nucleoside-diphosphate-sugar epimerase